MASGTPSNRSLPLVNNFAAIRSVAPSWSDCSGRLSTRGQQRKGDYLLVVKHFSAEL